MNDKNTRSGAMPIIDIENMVKVYTQDGGENISVLKEVDLKVYPGDMIAVMGPSGSGKSTLLFILGLFLSATSGQYLFDQEDVLKLSRSNQAEFRRTRVGFVFQSTDLLENSTVYENLEFPLIYTKVPRKDRPARIEEALNRVHLGHRMHHPSNRLSGGEKQRVAVARALVNKPRVILADEPTGQLDRDNTQVILDHFRKITEESQTAVVMVTHDALVGARCQKVYMMEDGRLWEDPSKVGSDGHLAGAHLDS